ncbi:unnamed protein product, partial [Choristocarpus tenellus]
MSWLWPLDALADACSVKETPGSALARALRAVPNDLVCGARRFRGGAGPWPPPSVIGAFVDRVVDLSKVVLTQRPPHHHPMLGRHLLIGLGLLYHTLAE